MLLCFPLATFLLPAKEFSSIENRYLEKFPQFNLTSVLDRSFMNGFENYVSDHFVGRDQWVAVKGYSEYAVGKRENNKIFLCENRLIEHLDKPNEDYIAANIQGINQLAENTSNANIYFSVIPSASSIQKQYLPVNAPGWDQLAVIEKVYAQVDGRVNTIDLASVLKEHKDEEIYYRTDHHWTTYGAGLAYQKLSQEMNLTGNSLLTQKVSENFYGTLYSKAGYRSITPDTIEACPVNIEECLVNNGTQTVSYPSIYFDEYLSQKDQYSYFLGSNQPRITIKTGSSSDRKLLLCKDSYAHALAPYLLQDYGEITLLDLRYINTDFSDQIALSEYDDILLLYSIDVFTHQKNPAKLSFLL